MQSDVTWLMLLQEYWEWSWQELALYDLSEMINHIYSLRNSKVFIVGHSQVWYLFFYFIASWYTLMLVIHWCTQGTIMSLAAFTQPDIAEMVEAAALLCPISYLDHISTQFVLRMVDVHLDQVLLVFIKFYRMDILCCQNWWLFSFL